MAAVTLVLQVPENCGEEKREEGGLASATSHPWDGENEPIMLMKLSISVQVCSLLRYRCETVEACVTQG